MFLRKTTKLRSNLRHLTLVESNAIQPHEKRINIGVNPTNNNTDNNTWSGCQLSVENNLAFALVLRNYALWLVSKIGATFLNQWEAKPKPTVICSHAFSRAWRQLHVFASNSDWFIVLLTYAVIGQSKTFAFGFTTLKRKQPQPYKQQ